jgi:hypothetical protein
LRNAYKILVRRPEGKRPLKRPRHRWKDNIRVKMCGMVAYSSEQEPMAGSHGHGNEPSGSSSVKGGKFLDQLSDY